VIDKVIVDEHVIDGRNVDTKRAVPRSNANRSEGNARYYSIVAHRIDTHIHSNVVNVSSS
jgi:hypothetical protein